MPPSKIKKQIEEKAFAQAYLDHGMNATQAALAIKPQIKPSSAGEIGSQLLKRVEQSGAIEPLMAGARAQWEAIARDCMQLLHNQAIAGDKDAHKLLIEYGKIFANANQGPKTAIQHNKYMLPKRT